MILVGCKRIGVNVREYLLEVLPQLSYGAVGPQLLGKRPLEELTPAGGKHSRSGTDADAKHPRQKEAEWRQVRTDRLQAWAVRRNPDHPARM